MFSEVSETGFARGNIPKNIKSESVCVLDKDVRAADVAQSEMPPLGAAEQRSTQV